MPAQFLQSPSEPSGLTLQLIIPCQEMTWWRESKTLLNLQHSYAQVTEELSTTTVHIIIMQSAKVDVINKISFLTHTELHSFLSMIYYYDQFN